VAVADDLDALLALFAAGEVSTAAQPRARAAAIWAELMASRDVTVLVAPRETGLAATCTLVTAPNLLRGGRRHGFLENVLTHPAHRRRGHGRAVVAAALEVAWRRDCHHVLLQSGRADPAVHRFYAGCGFVAGRRAAYVADRPGASPRARDRAHLR
jgi:GNAT superfamily N-acetyltransferase